MPKPADFDVIVIGAGVAGLGAAALLAKDHGKRVLVLERAPFIGGRTLSYVGYARVDNDSRAAYTFNVNSYAVAPGGNPQGFVLGTVHFF